MLLNIKFAKYQIYFCILPTYPKNFIGIKQVWPQVQTQRSTKVKIKIYTSIHYQFKLFECSDFGLLLWNKWFLDIFSCQKIISSSKPSIFQNLWNYLTQISENKTMPFFHNFYHESKTILVCKLGAWPQSAFEAVVESHLLDLGDIFRICG